MSTINEHNSTQPNASPSTNIQYGYPTNCFDFMNISPMQNLHDPYSYYSPNLYQQFNTFDEQNQWGSTDTSTGPVQYHPQIYTPLGVDIPRSPFDYPSTHGYPHYHPGFASPTGTSIFDMSWNPHNLSIQQQMSVVPQQQIPPIGGGLISNKKPSVYDEYPSTTGNVVDMLAQHINSLDLNNTNNNHNNGTSEHIQNLNNKQHSQTNMNNLSLTRPSQPSTTGPKSYASVVSSENIDSSNEKLTSSITNISNTQQIHYDRTTGLNSRYRQSNGLTLNWPNNNLNQSINNKQENNSLSHTISNNQQTSQTLKSNSQYNPKDFNLNPKGARFFVIKSYSEDDIHRSIKYNIWCSTEHGNKRLDSAFREREGKGPVYLFFSVNASGHFCGMAEMMSPVDYEHKTDVWHLSNKWQGKFEVKWIYVKDVPNQQFRNIRLENNDNKPVTNSRDTQEIPHEKGKLMLKTLHMYHHKTSIFDDFQYYESKQAEQTTTTITTKPILNDLNHSNRRQLSSNRISTTKQNENNKI